MYDETRNWTRVPHCHLPSRRYRLIAQQRRRRNNRDVRLGGHACTRKSTESTDAGARTHMSKLRPDSHTHPWRRCEVVARCLSSCWRVVLHPYRSRRYRRVNLLNLAKSLSERVQMIVFGNVPFAGSCMWAFRSRRTSVTIAVGSRGRLRRSMKMSGRCGLNSINRGSLIPSSSANATRRSWDVYVCACVCVCVY
jgi:hypothetical protein